MKKLFYKTILAALFIGTLASCDNQGYDDYDAGGTETEAMNGEWYIDISDNAGPLMAHTLHKIYDNNGALYITDRVGSTTTFAGWWLESQLDFDPEAQTFSATDALNTTDGSIVDITGGKILKGAAHSPSGVVVDSIYFEVVFDYDPENVYIYSGFRRTGFEEDE